MESRRRYRGKWDGLTASTFAALCGCSASHAKRLLAARKALLGRELLLADIGEMIYEFRHASHEKSLNAFLDRWTGPKSSLGSGR